MIVVVGGGILDMEEGRFRLRSAHMAVLDVPPSFEVFHR